MPLPRRARHIQRRAGKRPTWRGGERSRHRGKKRRGFPALPYLADYINVVEVNSTFYRPANPALVRSWLKKIEHRPDFFLSLKLHQVFTHKRTDFTHKDVD